MPKLFYREKNTAPTPTPKATPPATPPSEEALKDIQKTLKDLNLLGQDIKSHLASHDEKLSDHEARLRKLEGTESGDSSKDSSTGKSADKGTDKATGGSSKDSSTGKSADKADAPKGPQGAWWNGPRKVYKYWDYESRTYRTTTDIWAAKQASGGNYDPIWAWFKDGVIDHVLSNEEILRYVP